MGMGGPGSMRMGPRGFLTEEEKKILQDVINQVQEEFLVV